MNPVSQQSIERPPVPLELLETVSPSRLMTWLTCPRQFYARYVERIETPKSPAAFFGQVMHSVLAWYYGHRQIGIAVTLSELSEILASSWDLGVRAEPIEFGHHDKEIQMKQQASRLLRAYWDQFAHEEAEVVFVEQRLEAPLVDLVPGLPPIRLVGVLDLVLRTANRLRIIDFKTAARANPRLGLLHELQLTAYAVLLRSAQKTYESAVEIRQLVRTRVPEVTRHCFPRRDHYHVRRLLAAINAYRTGLSGQADYIRPGLHCGFCDYLELCQQPTLDCHAD